MERIKHTPMGTTMEHIPNEIFAIWLCKAGTYMMPYLYEMCICTWQTMNPDFKVVIYTDNVDLKFNFLSKDTTEVRLIQDCFPGLLEEACTIINDDVPEGMRFAHRSDYIRYSIIAKTLGVYIDADLMCISPIEDLVNTCIDNGQFVIMAKEDKIRIGNAFMTCLDERGIKYYEHILHNYREHYVKTSYTFNSIKYPMLLNHKYHDIVKVLEMEDGFFYPNWENNENGDLSMLKQQECPLHSYGVHLYNSDVKWKEFREQLERELYSDNSTWWIQNHLTSCIEKYIELMTEAKQRKLDENEHLFDSILHNYGEEYASNFRKEK